MFGGFLAAGGSPRQNGLGFWWTITWVNTLNAIFLGMLAFGAAAGVLLAWRWLGS